jgi:ribosomal protein S18 acetylase RimI-like enzyme
MTHAATVVVRRARSRDLPALGRLGASLARAHHRWDPRRFFVVPKMHEGYAEWLGKELRNRDAVLFTAEVGGRIVGYTYGRVEPRDWNALRDECGVAVDLVVIPGVRGRGVGRQLLEALLAALAAKGVPRVILLAAAKNADAQRLFRRLGFRPTVVEMTVELGGRRRRVSSRRDAGGRRGRRGSR